LFQYREFGEGVSLFQMVQGTDEAPHDYRKSAWTHDQYIHSDEKGFAAETAKPSGYQFKLSGLSQTGTDNMKKLHAEDIPTLFDWSEHPSHSQHHSSNDDDDDDDDG